MRLLEPVISDNIAALTRRLAYEFHNQALLTQALTHRSAGTQHNERLEFLGDGILNFVIASELYRLRPEFDEGQLSRMRATLVRKETLAEIAAELEVGSVLYLGTGELKSGGFERDSILADSVEALFGAIYLDGGFSACETVIQSLYSNRLCNLPDIELLKDAKTRLQEYLQARQLPLPEYTVVSTHGKAHEQQFRVRCAVPSLSLHAEAQALGRRRAEQSAAGELLNTLEDKQ